VCYFYMSKGMRREDGKMNTGNGKRGERREGMKGNGERVSASCREYTGTSEDVCPSVVTCTQKENL